MMMTKQQQSRQPDTRGTTLLDLLIRLQSQTDANEESLIRFARREIVTQRAILCGTYHDTDPADFA